MLTRTPSQFKTHKNYKNIFFCEYNQNPDLKNYPVKFETALETIRTVII